MIIMVITCIYECKKCNLVGFSKLFVRFIYYIYYIYKFKGGDRILPT